MTNQKTRAGDEPIAAGPGRILDDSMTEVHTMPPNAREARRWSRRAWLIATAWLAATPSRSVAAPDDRPAPESESLSFSITPGKPGAPTERVTVTRRGRSGEGTMRVARIGDLGGVLGEEVIPLPTADGADVWRIVDRERLRAFVPEVEPGEVADFGEVRLRIESRLAGGATTEAREVSWERSLRQAEAARIDALKNKLAALAGRAKTVRLSYLRER